MSQLGTAASKKGYKRQDQLEWLEQAVGVKITAEELTAHFNGKHQEA